MFIISFKPKPQSHPSQFQGSVSSAHVDVVTLRYFYLRRDQQETYTSPTHIMVLHPALNRIISGNLAFKDIKASGEHYIKSQLLLTLPKGYQSAHTPSLIGESRIKSSGASHLR